MPPPFQAVQDLKTLAGRPTPKSYTIPTVALVRSKAPPSDRVGFAFPVRARSAPAIRRVLTNRMGTVLVWAAFASTLP